MKTIDQLREDKKELEKQVWQLLRDFEEKHGEDIVGEIKFTRYNGSNSASGPICVLNIGLSIW